MTDTNNLQLREETPEERRATEEAALRLRAIWTAYKLKHKVNQTTFAREKLGWTQGNFSQYLNARLPIGMNALLNLAQALECEPGDIRPEFRSARLESLCIDMAKQFAKLADQVESLRAADQKGQSAIEGLVGEARSHADSIQEQVSVAV